MPQHRRTRLSVYTNSHDTISESSSSEPHREVNDDDMSSSQHQQPLSQETYRQVRPAVIRTRVDSFEEWEREAERKNLCVGECVIDHQQFREMRARQERLAEQEKELAKRRHYEQRHQYIQMLPNTDQAQFLAGEAFKRMRNATNMYRGSLKKSYEELDQAIQLLSAEQADIAAKMQQSSLKAGSNRASATRKKSYLPPNGPGASSTEADDAQRADIEEKKSLLDRVSSFVNERRLGVDLVNYSYINALADIVAELQRRETIYRDALMQLLSLEQDHHATTPRNAQQPQNRSFEQHASVLRNIQQQLPVNALQLGPDIDNLVHERQNLSNTQAVLSEHNQVLPKSALQGPLYSI